MSRYLNAGQNRLLCIIPLLCVTATQPPVAMVTMRLHVWVTSKTC